MAALNWLRLQGSNLDCRVQSAVSCHWTKPQISGRVIPSRSHVLENQLAPGFSPSHSHQPASHVGCASELSRLWNNRRAMRRKGENPQQFMLLNSSLRRASGTGASAHKRVTPVEGFTSRPSHCWVVFAEPEVSQLAWAPCGWLVRLAPFEPGSSRGGYLSGINPSNGQPCAPRYISRSVLIWADRRFEFIPAA